MRRRCRGGLVVCRFHEGGGTAGHGDEAQRIIVDSVRRSLPLSERRLIQGVGVTVGQGDEGFAAALQGRLGARFILYGRVASRTDGGWSVLPRLLERVDGPALHWDPFTRDVLPTRPSFGPIVSSLPIEHGVRDEEFPFEFAGDLQAVVRGIAGLVAKSQGDDAQAAQLLQQALDTAPNSGGHQIDALRAALALVKVSLAHAQEEDEFADDELEAEAVAMLRQRAASADASPHLLRTLHYVLYRRYQMDLRLTEPERQAHLEESVVLLRRAWADEGDPQRDMTAYNLMSALDNSDPNLGVAADNENQREANALLEHLLSSDSGYRRTWYLKLLVGARHWGRVIDARNSGADNHEVQAHAREAARWYRRALRARPRYGLPLLLGGRPPFIHLRRYPTSAQILTNLKDAHQVAGHRRRARRYERRFQRVRRRYIRHGHSRWNQQLWMGAHANFDWACVGRGDLTEVQARTHAAVAAWLSGRKKLGERGWREAFEAGEAYALQLRSDLAATLVDAGIDDPVPGGEPTDPSEIDAFCDERGLVPAELMEVMLASGLKPGDITLGRPGPPG